MVASPVLTLEERRLLPRHIEGDDQAFRELVNVYRAPVFGYLVRCGVPPAARDDLFQDVFLKIHGAAESYAPDRDLKPWIFTIVANTVRSYFRRAKLENVVEKSAEVDAPDSAPIGDQIAEAKQTAEWMEGAIARLPLEQRSVLILACIENLSMKDVSDALEIPVNTVKTHLRRARMALASQLARRTSTMANEVAR
jgi:RNA polymerase sigma-70 factor (ECF subfamily)